MGRLPAAIGLLLLAGCARDTIVLIPDESGHVGAITVTTAAGTQLVDTANTGVVVRSGGAPPAPEPVASERLESTFAPAIGARPKAEQRFILLFEEDSARLTPDARQRIPEVVEAIARRQPCDVSVVGHADTRASESHNLQLSQRRAQAVWNLLVERGADPERMDLTFHGENYPLVPTGDNVSEPRNRRVEVIIR